MPLYSYTCSKGHEQEEYRKIATRDDCPRCRTCRRQTTRIFSRQHVKVFTPYKAVGAERGRVIKNSADHRAYLRHHGYEEVGNDRSMAPPPDDPDYEQQRAKEFADAFKDLSHSPALD
jgi:putative FmdB family regulatory protein